MNTRLTNLGSATFRTHRGLLWSQLLPWFFLVGILVDSLTFNAWVDWAEMPRAQAWSLVAYILIFFANSMRAAAELYNWPTRLGVDASGLWVAREDDAPGYRVPWKAVREVAYRVEDPRLNPTLAWFEPHWLDLRLDPDAWRRPVEQLDGSRLEVPLGGLERPGVEVYSAIRGRWERWRRSEMVERSAGARSPGPARPGTSGEAAMQAA